MDEEPRKSEYINIIITEVICVLSMIVAVLVIKYFFKTEFKVLKKWYINQITADTRIEEVIE